MTFQQIATLMMTAAVLAGLPASAALAQEDVPSVQPGGHKYSPYPEQNFPNRVFFGDTHLHTSYSADAGMVGNTLGPEDAYRFVGSGVQATAARRTAAITARPITSRWMSLVPS